MIFSKTSSSFSTGSNVLSSFSWSKVSGIYEFAIHTAGTYTISGSLSSITPISSGYNHLNHQTATTNYSNFSMGAKIQFLSDGLIVAVGAQNYYGGNISVFEFNNNTALTTVSISGTGSTSTTPNYNYTTLSSPISVAANSTYQIIFKNSTGGYAYHNITYLVNTNTSSGNMKLISFGYISTTSTSTVPLRPTNDIYSWGYCATDLIFIEGKTYSVTFNYTGGNLATVSITVNDNTSGTVTRGNSLTLQYFSSTSTHRLSISLSGENSIDSYNISGGTGSLTSITHSGTNLTFNFTVTD